MLPRKKRLTRKDISLFFSSKNKFVKGDLVSLRVRVSKLDTRFAFVASSDKKRNATERALARRRMSFVVEQLLKLNKIKQGLDIMFFIRLSDKKCPSFNLIKNDIITLLTKVKILI
jgi:RNase P protein component